MIGGKSMRARFNHASGVAHATVHGKNKRYREEMRDAVEPFLQAGSRLGCLITAGALPCA